MATTNAVRGVRPVFINKDTRQPLKNVWLYAYRHSDNGDKLISVHQTDENGRLKRRLYVPRERYDYYFYVAAFELAKTITASSSSSRTSITNEFMPDNQMRTRANNIVTTESNLTTSNSRLIWVINSSEQSIELQFTSNTHKELYNFKISATSGAWTGLSKTTIINEMIDRIKNPYKVHQRNTDLCGPTSIVFTLIFKNAIKYVQTYKELFENGYITRNGKRYQPHSSTLSNSNPQDDGYPISQADWILAATLREDANLYADADSSVGGMTLPMAVRDWGTSIVGSDTVQHIIPIEGQLLLVLNQVLQSMNNGAFALMLIDCNMIENELTIIRFPTHWIAVTQLSYNSSNENFNFVYHTWGRRRTMSKSIFNMARHIFGIVVIQ